MKNTDIMLLILMIIIIILITVGILTLSGCTFKSDDKVAVLSFHSFDGGGPEYSVSIGNPELLSYQSKTEYLDKDHDQMTGAGYDEIFAFTGLKPGNTIVTITSSSPIVESETITYDAVIDDQLKVTLTKRTDQTESPLAITPTPTLIMALNDNVYYLSIEENETAEAFIDLCSTGELTVNMTDNATNEIIGKIDQALPTRNTNSTAQAGDLIFYEDNQIAICYEPLEGSFIKFASCDAITKEVIKDSLKNHQIELTFWAEWSE